MALPIHDIESEIVARLRESPRLVVSAPTGSGKSTQIPQMLLKHGFLDRGEVVILQPRRIAARLLAARVAEEMAVELGREVGYQVRFENATSAATKIRFVTEGILLRQMIDDPSLKGVAAVIFDEFHERHLYGDITLARAVEIKDLRILVMSATLDLDALKAYLAPCGVVRSEGRQYPVTMQHAPAEEPWSGAADAFERYVDEGGEGDVLVFMPGGYEISRTLEAIRERKASKGFVLLPLHGELSPKDQDAAVARYSQRKVVVATNVAETSLTIDGVRLVIDSGLARIPRYDPNRGINTLLIEKISKASAEQRAGRAGRTAPGVCVRLWPERENRAARELPEIKRLDLSEVVLTLKSAGIADLRTFRWLEAPTETALAHAEDLLADLGALEKGAITPLGRRMLAFPLHPRYARMLIAAQDAGCVYEAALVAALTQGRDLLLRNVDSMTSKFREDRFGAKAASDFDVLMKAWEYAVQNEFRLEACRKAGIHAVTARQVGPLLDQFLRIAEREKLDVRRRGAPPEALRKCILIGFSDRVARRLDEGTLRCEIVHGRRGTLARESVVRSPLFVAAEIREVEGKNVDTLLSLATALEVEWLKELFPDDIAKRTAVAFDAGPKRVVAEEQVRFRDLVLESRRLEHAPADAAARMLAEEVTQGRLRLDGWNDAVEQWIARVNFLARTCPDLALPAIGEAERREIIGHLCHGAESWKEIKDRPALPVAREWLSGAQQDLVEKHAPERVELPNGRKPKVTYPGDATPWIAAKIQDLYDVSRIPKVAMGRVELLVHILGPNQRPVQITQDLAGFWREHYPKMKKELQRRYPKHEWR